MMNIAQQRQIEHTIAQLYNDAKYDRVRMAKAMTSSLFRAIQPADFHNVYLSISKKQGEDLSRLVQDANIKNIVEFGTSFGISTLFLALGAIATKGHIITTELIPSKAERAVENFRTAGVDDLIEVRVGDAMETLSAHRAPIDLLFLDGWKDLYLPLFRMLEPNFHGKTLI
ncbi:MAG: class I SAM-dependent methyltransferase, partial [Bacteroidota bacterium]